MVKQYVCQFCNNLVAYYDDHACPVLLKRNYENSQIMNSLPATNKEQGAFGCDLSRKRTFSSLSDGTFVEAQQVIPHDALHLPSTSNIRPNEIYSEKNYPFKPAIENFEPGYKSSRRVSVDYKREASIPEGFYQQNKFETKSSNSEHVAFSKESQMFLKESILNYIADEEFLIESSGIGQANPLHQTNLPATENFLVKPVYLSGNKETNKDAFEEVGDLRNTFISSNASSRTLFRSEGLAANFKEPLDSFRIPASSLEGPSGICDDWLRAEKRQFICDRCQLSFDRKSEFEEHYQTHTVQKPFQCNTCKRRFTRKAYLTYHYRTHTGEKPFVCVECGKAFARKDIHDDHYRTHTCEKPYVCHICKKGFAKKGTLDQHYRTHTGEKPYVCEICKRTFTLKHNLKVHNRTHTGEKPYKCHRCKKCFADNSNLIKHAKTHTKDES